MEKLMKPNAWNNYMGTNNVANSPNVQQFIQHYQIGRSW
jgi:hypothetical protein